MKDLLLNLNVNKPNMKFGEMVMTEVKDQLCVLISFSYSCYSNFMSQPLQDHANMGSVK